MKLLTNLLGKFGYHKTQVNHIRYAAAAQGRLLGDFFPDNISTDDDLRGSLRILRGRSRTLANDNDYFKRYLRMIVVNVLGSKGIQFQNKAKEADPKDKSKMVFDTRANRLIEDAYKEWSGRGSCTVCGNLSLRDVERISLQAAARDGEVLIHMRSGFDNKYGFALQMYEADHLDEKHNIPAKGTQNKIEMGIEINTWGRPVAYHLLKKHPGNGSVYSNRKEYTRVPAEEIIHLYLKDRPSQSRGVPWGHTAMRRLNQVGKYEESEAIAARIGASKMGFFTSATGESYIGADKAPDGSIITDAEPGTFEQLPAGTDFVPWDPSHPGGNFAPFIKAMLRGAASGLGVAYHSLANDLEGVNFSSIRAGTLEERDMWRVLQSWFIEHFSLRIYATWLEQALFTKALPLPYNKFDKFNKPSFRPRGWAWVDPLKDQKANLAAVEAGMETKTNIVAEKGLDIEEVYETLAYEKELEGKYDLQFTTDKGNTL